LILFDTLAIDFQINLRSSSIELQIRNYSIYSRDHVRLLW